MLILFNRLKGPLLAAILALTFSQPSMGTDILGQVSDSVTGLPLANAKVIVYETGDSTTTDANGNYFISSIPNGVYTFLIGSADYSPLILRSVLVGSGCCLGAIRGNVDYDHGDGIDISDLVYLVDYMFVSGPMPPCLQEADLNADNGIDISDLVYLVDYMFVGGPEPLPCQ